MERWAGKTALVTGASAGIGAEIVIELANAGMVVVAAARRLDKLQELQKQYKGRGRILPCRCDMSKESDIEQLMDFAKKNANGIDVLVNNAAVLPPGTVTDVTGEGTDMKVIEECYKTNVIGVIKATRLAAADMVARNVKGHIFVINSIVGHKTVNVGKLAKSSVYGSTKRAITELVENIRLEFSYTATPIKITSISPGAVDTAMLASVPGLMSGIPMLKGKEVAQALVVVGIPRFPSTFRGGGPKTGFWSIES